MKFIKNIIITLIFVFYNNVFCAEINDIKSVKDKFQADFGMPFEDFVTILIKEVFQLGLKSLPYRFVNQVIKKEITLSQALCGINEAIANLESSQKYLDADLKKYIGILQQNKPGMFEFNEIQLAELNRICNEFLNSTLQELQKQKDLIKKLMRNQNSHLIILFLNEELTDKLIDLFTFNDNVTQEDLDLFNVVREIKKIYGYGPKAKGPCESLGCAIL